MHQSSAPPLHLLRDMALFVEVARRRSFTAAAAHLGLPPSTLSRRIAALERSLGLALLSRSTRRVDTTDAGRDYLARCADLVEAARVAHEAVGRGTQTVTGTLRLSCTPDFAGFYLPALLEALTREHPALDVELDLSPRAVDLRTESLDAAVRIGALPDSALVARPLGHLRRGFYAAPSYLDAAGAPQDPDELGDHMAVRLQGGEAGQRWRLRPASGGPVREVAVRGRFAAGSLGMVRELVLRGAGIGALDEAMAAADLREGRLRRVLPGWSLTDAPVHLLTVSRYVPARVRVFGDRLAARLTAPG